MTVVHWQAGELLATPILLQGISCPPPPLQRAGALGGIIDTGIIGTGTR
jgi:hypothetical protein